MTVQSVSRAFTILKVLAHQPLGVGVSELARELDIHKSTVSRLLSTLEVENAVEKLPNGGGYRIASGLLDLIPQIDQREYLISLLTPLLAELAGQVGEAVGLSVAAGDSSLTIKLIQSSHSIQVRDYTGEQFPLHVSSSGKHYLANWSTEKFEAYLGQQLDALTSESIIVPQILRARVAKVREQGYDWTFDEFEEGLAAVSAPLFNSNSRVVAAIYISGPRFRFPPPGLQEMITTHLLRCRQQAQDLVRRMPLNLSGSLIA